MAQKNQDMKEQVERFIRQCQKSQMVPAVILGSAVNGLSYLRSLCVKNIPVLCMDHNLGYSSKSCLGTFLLLEIKNDEDIPGETSADRVFERLSAEGIHPVVFGSADEWQVYIARRSDTDNPNFMTLSPGRKTMELIIDKQAQYEKASKVGITVPAFANAAEVLSGKKNWEEFPAIIKPRWAHLGRKSIGDIKALNADTPELLMQELEKLQKEAQVEDFLVQKVISGADGCLYGYLACFDADGSEFAWLIKRKLRQYPPNFGDGSYDVTCQDESLAQAARKLLASLDYCGLVGVEFKRQPDSKEFGLIEINPRTVSTNQIATVAGIDFPWLAYQLVVHREFPGKMSAPKAPKSYRVGVAHVNEERDFMGFLLRWKSKELGFFEWFSSIMKAESFALWNRRDPIPFVTMVMTRTSSRFKKIFN